MQLNKRKTNRKGKIEKGWGNSLTLWWYDASK